jgi:threonine dehydratase
MVDPQVPPSDLIVPLAKIEAARAIIAPHVHRTPLLSSASAARVVEAATGARIGDGRVYLKAEHLQVTGSYKPRGALARVAALTPEERGRGIVTISAGNAAQGYAYAGAVFGVHVTVVMPANANPGKVAACRGYGAEVVLEGADVGETLEAMERLRAQRGLVLAHPFNDPDVISGTASVGLEIVEDQPAIDVVVVGVGGGGLVSGVAAAIKERRPGARVYAVEPEGSDALRQGLAAGHPVRIVPHSVADGLNGPFAGEWNIAMARRYVDDVIVISDAVILGGLRFALERTKQVLEPAGAAALAALLAGRVPVRDGERVAAVLSGGNVDLTRLGELLAAAPIVPVPPAISASVVAELGAMPAAVAPTEPPRPVTEPPRPVTEPHDLPGARQLVAAGLQLARASSRELRSASIFIGLLALAAFGPALAFGLVVLERFDVPNRDPFDYLGDPAFGTAVALLYALGIGGILLFLAISYDAQIIAVSLLGGRATGRPLRLSEAVTRARQVFWRLLAGGLLIGVVSATVSTIVSFAAIGLTDSAFAADAGATLLSALVTAPFAYFATSVVLGDVGPLESLRRSIRLVRARPSLAAVVVLFTLLTSAIQVFALSSGLDVVVRISDVLHLSLTDVGPGLLLSVVLLVAAVVAIGSLVFTVAAIVAAPQVEAFLGLTHFSGGLDRARSAGGPPPRFRWLTLKMAGAIVLLAVGAGVGIPVVATSPVQGPNPVVQFVRSAATAAGDTVAPFGQLVWVDDPVGDTAPPSRADMDGAGYAIVPYVPTWLLGRFDCAAPKVACDLGQWADGYQRDAAFSGGALLVVQRLQVPEVSISDGSHWEWAVVLQLDGHPADPDPTGPLAGATDAFVTDVTFSTRGVAHLSYDGGVQANRTFARSSWVGDELATLIPLADEITGQVVAWDASVRWTPAAGAPVDDSLRIAGALHRFDPAPTLEFLPTPSGLPF